MKGSSTNHLLRRDEGSTSTASQTFRLCRETYIVFWFFRGKNSNYILPILSTLIKIYYNNFYSDSYMMTLAVEAGDLIYR